MGYITPNTNVDINLDQSGLSTADNQIVQNDILNSILTAVNSKYSFAETIWVDSDSPPTYWVKRTYQNPDTFEISTTFSKPNGSIGTPVGIISPIVGSSSNNTTFIETTDYDVIVSGVNYSQGDLITKTLIREISTGVVIDTFWYNQTTNVIINIINIDYAKIEKSSNTVTVINDSLGNINDVMATGEVGSFSINSLLRRISFYIKGIFDKDFATSTKQDILNTNLVNKLDTLNSKDFATSTKQDILNTNLVNKLDTLNSKDFATSTKQDILNTNLGSSDDVIANSDSGTFSLISLIKRVNNRLTTLINKDFATEVTLNSILTKLNGTVLVDDGHVQSLTNTELRASAVNISGTVTADTGLSQPLTNTELRANPVEVIIDNSVKIDQSIDGDTNLVSAKQNGNWNITSISNPVEVTGQFYQTVQPISDNNSSITVDGSVNVTQANGNVLHTIIDSGTISLPTNSATESKQDATNNILTDIKNSLPTQPLTDLQLRASALNTYDNNLGSVDNSLSINPASNASVISLLKGLLDRNNNIVTNQTDSLNTLIGVDSRNLTSLYDKLSQITTGLNNLISIQQSTKDFEQEVFRDSTDTIYILKTSRDVDGNYTNTTVLPDGITPYTPVLPVSLAVTSTNGVDYEFQYSYYIATNTDVEYTAGDKIRQSSLFNVTSGTPVLSSTIWFNQTTLQYISEPTLTDLTVNTEFASETTLANIYSKLQDFLNVKLYDGSNNIAFKQYNNSISGTDYYIPTNTVIHGESTAGGGTFVGVKVTPSGALTTDTNIVGTVPVSGTFYQATQPVSIASWSGLTDTELRASAIPVSLSSTTISGTVAATQSGTWNIESIGTLPALPTGTNTIGAISNTSFSINGTLPNFAVTPTFNIGTISTIATAARQDALFATIGDHTTVTGAGNTVIDNLMNTYGLLINASTTWQNTLDTCVEMSNSGIGSYNNSPAASYSAGANVIEILKGMWRDLHASQAYDYVNIQNVIVGASSTASSAMNSSTKKVFITSNVDCWVGFNKTGIAPTASVGGANCFYLAAGVQTNPILVTGGTSKFSVIQVSTGGRLTIFESV